MLTCLDCPQPAEPGRVYCAEHHAHFAAADRRWVARASFFFTVALVLITIVACSYAGAHVLRSSWANVFHYNP